MLARIAIRNYASVIARNYIGKIITITSGKGGVGYVLLIIYFMIFHFSLWIRKTTTAASIAFGLADKGFRTVAVDFDIGLRNLDIHFGCERRVIFDFVNVLQQGI